MTAPDRDPATSLLGEVRVLPDEAAVAEAAAEWLQTAEGLLRTHPLRFTIALAGGGTPVALYDLLADDPWSRGLDWPAWHVFYGDERAVPPDDPDSNHRLARDHLLAHVPVPAEQIHRMRGEAGDLDAAAAEYSQLLAQHLPPGPGGAPRLDVVLLGLGSNGHTASLFPGTPALGVTDAWATRGRADYRPFDRITLTYPTLNAAATVAFMVTGPSKADALRATRDGTSPAAGVVPADGGLIWFLDEPAARSMAG